MVMKALNISKDTNTLSNYTKCVLWVDEIVRIKYNRMNIKRKTRISCICNQVDIMGSGQTGIQVEFYSTGDILR